MSELRKANTDYPYFATLTVAGWIDIFTRQRYCELILENWRYCIEEKDLLIYAYVIMPSHIHLVARQNEGHLDTLLRDFKSYTAKEIIKLIKQEKGESRKECLPARSRFGEGKGYCICLNILQNIKNKMQNICSGRRPVILLN